MIKIKLIFFTFLFVLSSSIAQTDSFFNNLRLYQLEDATRAISLLPPNCQPLAAWQVTFQKEFDTSSDSFKSLGQLDKPNDNSTGDYIYYINWGDFYFYNTLDENIKSINNYKKALAIAKQEENRLLTAEALKRILTLHRIHYLYNNKTYLPFLEDYQEIVYDPYEEAYYHYFNLILNFKNYDVENWSNTSYTALSKYFKNNRKPYLQGISETVFASYFEEINEIDSIWHYAHSAERNLSEIPYNYKGSRLNQIYSFMSRIALQQQDFESAAKYTDSATKKMFTSIDLKPRSLGHYQKSVIDSARGDFLSAYDESMKYRGSMATIEEAAQNELFNELQVKYESAEKEKQIIIEQQRKKQNRNIAISLGGVLVAVTVIGFLAFINTKRKQRIAEQQRELEIQKTEKLLKEQELTSIDAMIQGQEKERQRLASDLHDSVGATLAAAKLQFQHLANNREKGDITEELFEKTGKLLDDAYTEIRTMAHVKNSGVIAKNGLLPAVQKLARNASGVNGLTIEVEDYGLEERLDNLLEIAVFRVIQELVTNIIKHAKATQASIAINQYEDSLSIIIEDNGIGFNARQLPQKDGMGLSSIEKRIEHLEGTMEVDSTLGKGTHILIDIPL